VYGYIPYALIQPDIEQNTEAKVFCFNGVPIDVNPFKEGRGHSTLGLQDNSRLLKFAGEVCKQIRDTCPYLIADQLLRIDFFEYRGIFIVNEVEGIFILYHYLTCYYLPAICEMYRFRGPVLWRRSIKTVHLRRSVVD
jgi:hypothetical protein